VSPPDTGGGPPRVTETLDLTCPVQNRTAACNTEKESAMRLVVDRVKDCNISSSSHELSMSLINGVNGNNVVVTIPSYTGTGRYQLASKVILTGLVNGTNEQEPASIGTSQCTGACEAQVKDDSPPGPGPHRVKINVACPNVCPANSCRVCTEVSSSGGVGVEFAYSMTCNWN
jgi:hypothetical protein